MKTELKRVCIYPKDIQRITGKSYRQSIRLMQKIRIDFQKMLLYPSSKVLITDFGKFHKGNQTNNLCKLGFVNVVDSYGNLDLNIGKVVMNLMKI